MPSTLNLLLDAVLVVDGMLSITQRCRFMVATGKVAMLRGRCGRNGKAWVAMRKGTRRSISMKTIK